MLTTQVITRLLVGVLNVYVTERISALRKTYLQNRFHLQMSQLKARKTVNKKSMFIIFTDPLRTFY